MFVRGWHIPFLALTAIGCHAVPGRVDDGFEPSPRADHPRTTAASRSASSAAANAMVEPAVVDDRVRPVSASGPASDAEGLARSAAHFVASEVQPLFAPVGADDDAPPPSQPEAPLPDPDADAGEPKDDPAEPGLLPPPVDAGPDDAILSLDEVVESIYAAYPLLESAYRERDVRRGGQVSAWGAFDTKLKGDTTNQPVGFYRTYRQKIGVDQPIFDGGNVFAQYRLGRGQFEPWYEERNTNDGGEFKAGVVVPLLQGRPIDERRADLFKAQVDLDVVEPEIRGQLIEFVRAGSFAYWDWVAAGENTRIAQALLDNALDRTDGLRERVKLGALEEIALTDNDRILASRRAKLVDAQRKLRQSAIKLSLFLRNSDGTPNIPADDRLPPRFPAPLEVDLDQSEGDVARALSRRPEMEIVEFARQRAEIDLRQARNMTAPQLDAGFLGSQDVGFPTSKKRDKSRFELEAGLVLEVPLQRRKARGKIVQTEAKLAQINAKRRFTMDKIAVEVRNALTAVEATYRSYLQAQQSLELARRMEEAERTKFDEGASDLFLLNAREKQTAEAGLEVVAALADHFRAIADLRAALGELEPAGAGDD